LDIVGVGGKNPEQKRIPNNNKTRDQSIKRVLPHSILRSLMLWRAHAQGYSVSPREMAHRASKNLIATGYDYAKLFET
jgi:hypothetical protein